MNPDFRAMNWFDFLDHGQKDLVLLTQELYEREISEKSSFHDYSFVVFPMAKAYEGFLKKYFYELGLIGQKTYEGDRFRIGKSLNPDLPEKYRNHTWVVDELNKKCGKIQLASQQELLSRVLWNCWKDCRNLLFHYFPHHEHFISLHETRVRIDQISQAMGVALVCKNDLGF